MASGLCLAVPRKNLWVLTCEEHRLVFTERIMYPRPRVFCFCILKRVNLGMLINHQTSRELGDFVEIFDRYDAESLAVIDRQQKKLVADERVSLYHQWTLKLKLVGLVSHHPVPLRRESSIL